MPGGAGAQAARAPDVRCLAPTDAAGIDAMLARAGSPLAGQGATFVAEGVAAGIDPRLLLAIAAHETRLGAHAPARAIHNPFGLGPGIIFGSDTAAIARAARTLDDYYVQEGRIRIGTIGPKWAPIGAANDPRGLNRHWVAGVGAQYAALGGDPDAPVLIGSQAATCPAPASAGPGATAAATPRAPGDRSSGPAEITTWGGAALMIALVGYLAARRRRVTAAAASRGARVAWAPDGRGADAASAALATARAQTAATATPPGIAASGEDDVIEDAEWMLDEGAASGEETHETRPADVPPEEAAAPAEAGAEDPAAAFWAWAEAECAAHDDAEPGWPLDRRPDEPLETEEAPPTTTTTAAAAEPAHVDEAGAGDGDGVAEQAAIVADLVPALLEGLLPIERVCDRAEVTPRMLAMMRIVADTPLPVTEQARRLGVPRPVVAGLCARMEGLGLAQREPLAGDARRSAVALTASGYELCADSASAPDPTRVEAVLSRMTAAERAALVAGLSALASPSAG